MDKAGPAAAGDTAVDFLADQTTAARLWPDDDLVRSSLESGPVYTSLLRARLRMILEALEDDLRTAYGEGQPAPRNLTIEHILPQSWQTNWPLEPGDIAGAVERERLVHLLGNLTLVSGRLNPALSNRPWTNQEGTGKRDYLLQHSALKLNANVIADHPDAWYEEDIRARTAALTERLLTLWPRPAGVTAVPLAEVQVDQQPTASADEQFPEDEDPNIAPHTGRYRLLYWWLKAQDADELPLDFEQVEQIAGVQLPPSARLHPAHWYGYEGSAVARAIRDAGWKASRVNLSAQSLTFIRTASGEAI